MQLLASNKENQLTFQNNENLNNPLTVSKPLVDNINTKCAEAIEQINKSVKTFVDPDKTFKALKKANEEIVRLTKKTEESVKTI